jgi:hypothetical protein
MIRIFIVLGIVLILGGCGRKTTPSIIYQDVLKTNYDTIVSYVDGGTDTIYSAVPCDSFTMVIRKTDTIYIRKIQRETQVKLVTKHDTIIRQPIIVRNGKTVVKTDNSVTAKKGSIIGNDNTMTTKKNNWWWIFLCGMLVMFLIQNLLFRMLKTYFPFLKFLP